MPHDPKLIAALGAKANALRIDSIRAITKAGSGHPSTCMSAAEIMSVLFLHVMRWDPKDPGNRFADRFVLSKGHGAPVLYAAWAEAGAISKADVMSLRQIDSDFEGHPTPRLPFVDVATGSLGQGLGAGVGLALNSKYLDKSNYRTFVLLGDGEVAEGSVWEAAAMGGHYKLDNLVAILDANRLGQSQATAVGHHTEVYQGRFEAFGWNTRVVDGHDVAALLDAFDQAGESHDKPFAIIARTFKGKGVSFLENKDGWHGKPLKKGEEEDKAIAEIQAAGAETDYPFDLQLLSHSVMTEPDSRKMAPPDYKAGDSVATREAYGTALVKLGHANARVVALDADTKNSTFSDRFMKEFPERFFECFIAEQNMISVAAGLSSRDKIPFASTFAVFLGRGFDQIRMAGISHSNIKLCGSHVGVSIGEDGPSQMGLEDLGVFRAIPGCVVFYPSDAVSAERAVGLAAQHKGMAYIRTSRPKTAILYKNDEPFEIGKAKVVRRSDKDSITIATAGITLFEAIKAQELLASEGIGVRILDLFTIKPIDQAALIQNASETGNRILTVEDHYLEGGIGDAVSAAISETDIRVYRIGVVEVPRSGPPDDLVAKYGIDSKAIVARIRAAVK
ncbi:MAG: transketolase [Candidatus Sumerlaeaceae bacterium]